MMTDQLKAIIITSNEDLIRQLSQSKATNTLILELNNDKQLTSIPKNDGTDFLAQLSELNSTINQAYKRALEQNRPKPAKAPKKSIDFVCAICGDRAIAFNYNVLSCGSCKAFFRRNISQQTKRTMICLTGQNQCSVAYDEFRKCKRCRLEKCLTMGMRKDLILTDEVKQQRKQRSKDKPKNSSISQTITSSAQILDETDHLLMDIVEGNRDVPQDELADTLSLEDWLIIQDVHLSCLSIIQTRPARYPSFDLSSRPAALISWAKFANQAGLHFISFFRHLSEFENLHDDDRFILVKYNLLPLFPVFKCFDYDAADDCCSHENNEKTDQHRQFFMLCNESADSRKSFIDLIHSLTHITERDSTLVSLLLTVLIFCQGLSMSDDEPVFNDSLAVYRAQAHYTKVMWNYMVSRQGQTKACKQFIQLLAGIFRIQYTARRYRDFFRFQLASSNIVDDIAPLLQTVLRIS